MPARLTVTRSQVLAFRRSVQALDTRLPPGPRSLRRAAWAGLQDSMPRAALLSIHARVRATTPATWQAPSLVHVWGPRYSAFLIDARDVAVFTLGRLAEDAPARRVGDDLAARLERLLGTTRMSCTEAARALGMSANRIRYASLTGRIVIHWDGARQPTIWMAPPPAIEPGQARLELARRFLHVFGPSTAEAFAVWAGVPPPLARGAFDALRRSLVAVQTPVGEAWLLDSDEAALRAGPVAPASARLLPSGDTYFLLQGAERTLLLPEAAHRRALWTPRVWPGALLVDGEVTGTWRRAGGVVTIETWRRLSRAACVVVEGEVATLPLPGTEQPPQARWLGQAPRT